MANCMGRSLPLLGLIMCCGIAVASAENRYGGDSANPEAVTTWQPNRFLKATPEGAVTWRPNHFLKPKSQTSQPPSGPVTSDYSRPGSSGSGPRDAIAGPSVNRRAANGPGSGVVTGRSAIVPVPRTPHAAGPDLHTAPLLASTDSRPAGLNLRTAPAPIFRSNRPVAPNLLTARSGRYPWKLGIVTTIFWVGEYATARNPVPNRQSAWDKHWNASYGGYDNPNRWARRNYMPVSFVPRQNPFYVALPYNDIERHHTKREAAYVIPWFRETFVRDGQTVLKDRWVAIRHGNRICYAQWEDCGPFRTDHWQYVFGRERPRPNLNQGAGLDVSPAIRDYLGLANKDVCDWRFVDSVEVPSGPWLFYGRHRPFALVDR
jgi:hypothetical protein